MSQCASGAEGLVLDGEHEFGIGSAVEVRHDLVGAVADAQDQPAQSLPDQFVDQDVEKGAPQNYRQSLRPILHRGLQPRAEPAAQNQAVEGRYRGRGRFLLLRYQSMVLLSPSLRSTLARKPSSDCAFCVSIRRIGIIVGFVGSNRTWASR